MKKSKAKELLGYNIPDLQNMSLDERIDKYRDLYCPNFFELNGKRNESAIKSFMFDKMVKDYKGMGPDVASNAFVSFSEVNEAYNTLSKDDEYDKLSLEFNKLREYDNKRYGEKLGKFKHILSKIASYGYIFSILLVVWMFSAFLIDSHELVGVISVLIVGGWASTWLADFIYSPIDKLLVVPYKVVDYVVKTWKKKRFILWKLILCYLFGWLGAILGFFSFFLNTGAGYSTRLVRYRYNKKYKNFCKELINERYERTVKEIDDYLNSKGGDEYKNSVEAQKYYMEKLGEKISELAENGKDMVLANNSFYAAKLRFCENEIEASNKEAGMAAVQLDREKQAANARRTAYMFADDNARVESYNEADRFFDKAGAKLDYENKVQEANEKCWKNTQELEIVNARVAVAAVKSAYVNETCQVNA